MTPTFPALAAAWCALAIAISGFFARSHADWWLENLVIAIFFGAIAWNWRRLPLSTSSIWLLFLLLCLHEYGAAYAYGPPVGEWMRPYVGMDRNHYDRLVHGMYGVLSFPAFRELSKGSRVQAINWVLATSAIYEMLEWLVTAAVNPALGAEFVGAQGDDFDAAKDMALAFGGALFTMLVTFRRPAPSPAQSS